MERLIIAAILLAVALYILVRTLKDMHLQEKMHDRQSLFFRCSDELAMNGRDALAAVDVWTEDDYRQAAEEYGLPDPDDNEIRELMEQRQIMLDNEWSETDRWRDIAAHIEEYCETKEKEANNA